MVWLRQARLSTIQGLDLAFLVHAQHQRVFRRIQIQAHDVFQLFRERRIVADLETLDPVRFQAVTVPDPTHAGLADAHRSGHTARAPVGGVGRLLPSRQVHHTPHKTSRDLGRTTGPGRIAFQAGQAQGQEPATPARYFLGRDPQGGRDLLVLPAFGGQQHDPSTFHHACRKRPAASPLLQGGVLVRTQGDGWGDPHPLGLLPIRRVRNYKGYYL
jgi:hypothetical protein